MIVDTCGFVPTMENVRYRVDGMCRQLGYMKVFWRAFAQPAGLTKEQFFEGISDPRDRRRFGSTVERIAEARSKPLAGFVKEMDAAGIQTMVLHNYDVQTTLGVDPIPYEYHAELATKYPSRFLVLAAVDPLKGARAVEQLEYCVRELGYKGLLLAPFRQRISLLDERCDALLAKCQQLGGVAWIHCCHHWDATLPMDLSHPRTIDEVARKYPELTIIAGHAGWPWVLDLVCVASRHRNVYLEYSAFAPKNLVLPDFGFRPLLHFGTTTLRDKITVGSTSELVNLSLVEIAKQYAEWPLPSDVAVRWFYATAASIMGLAEGGATGVN